MADQTTSVQIQVGLNVEGHDLIDRLKTSLTGLQRQIRDRIVGLFILDKPGRRCHLQRS
ncbi:hypothetical protein [Microvirga arsenatis]|uniref:Uncharacterized protein n=1 Tax=Microvirga arsenatis TaxID=2692265 RepID=A0ABW9YUM5_9HYPH|nr:hypothetical protein [Microvirga arsenatis]NBJ09337.1 hypothetical protein [Microvirga arsenatis]NBJ23805.1 hypothetical protein [Microvirga arsenatis]